MKKKIRLERTLNHSQQKVWDAISSGVEISKWFLEADFKAEVGYSYTFSHDEEGGGKTIITGEVLEADEPNKLSYTWEVQGSNINSTVDWILSETAGKTLVVIEHESEDDEDSNPAITQMFMEFEKGWEGVYAELEKFLK